MTMMSILNQVAPGRHVRPARLSEQLRTGTSADLSRRRGVVGLALLGAGAMAAVSLYQTGIIRHLPELPLPGFDAEEAEASTRAYSSAAAPSGLLELTSFAVTATLAAAGGEDRARRRPWLSLALAGKVVADAFAAAKLAYDQWTKHRARSPWHLFGAAASLAMLPLVAPEARRAARQVWRGRGG